MDTLAYVEDPRHLFKPARTYLEEADDDVPWLLPGYIAQGNVTLLSAREKLGKSVLMFVIAKAISAGIELLGRPCTRTGVLVLSEEGRLSLREKVRNLDLGAPDDMPVDILDRRDGFDLKPMSWHMVARWTKIVSLERHYGLVIVDTLRHWGELQAEQENDAGSIRTVMAPLLELASEGLAVLVLHHNNKMGDVSGSTAIGATADIIMKLSRGPHGPRNRRLITAIGRYDATPEDLHYELEKGDIWSIRLVESATGSGHVLRTLEENDEPMTQAMLAEETGLSQGALSRVLGQLEEDGRVLVRGTGGRHDPKTYRRLT